MSKGRRLMLEHLVLVTLEKDIEMLNNVILNIEEVADNDLVELVDLLAEGKDLHEAIKRFTT